MWNCLWWIPQDFIDDKSAFGEIMAWCCQATSYYLSQCWSRSMSPYGVTRPQWVKLHDADKQKIQPPFLLDQYPLSVLQVLRCVTLTMYHSQFMSQANTNQLCVVIQFLATRSQNHFVLACAHLSVVILTLMHSEYITKMFADYNSAGKIMSETSPWISWTNYIKFYSIESIGRIRKNDDSMDWVGATSTGKIQWTQFRSSQQHSKKCFLCGSLNWNKWETWNWYLNNVQHPFVNKNPTLYLQKTRFCSRTLHPHWVCKNQSPITVSPFYTEYSQTSNISCIKTKISDISHLVKVQLSLPNPLKPGVKSRMKM